MEGNNSGLELAKKAPRGSWTMAQKEQAVGESNLTGPNVADVAKRHGIPLDAVPVYNEYIAGAGSDDWDGIAERGEAYAQAHEWVKAGQDYQRALQLSPDNPRVLGMITTLDLQTGDWARALKDSTRWLALEPGQSLAVTARAIALSHLPNGISPDSRQ